MIRFITYCLGILAVVFFCFMVTSVYLMNAHALPIKSIEMTQVGQSTEDVMSRLGSPSRIDKSESGESWVYSGMTWCYVTVYFDNDGLVESVDHDH